jgi:putative PEP-CTERM system histidine kinase
MVEMLLLLSIGAIGVAIIIAVIVPSLRASFRVHLLKLLGRYRYDYRREWLRFISTLSSARSEQVNDIAVKAVSQIVRSPGGIVWAKLPDETIYRPVGSWECDIPSRASISEESDLIRFLEQRQWIIDLIEIMQHPQRYDGLKLDGVFGRHSDWWLIVPLLLGDRLFGFIVLLKPLITFQLNFEDHDLLKTIGKQVATHINQTEIDRRLAEISQFTTYNRLSAYLMHDLSNLIAQHSLVVQNAERFRDNPAFVDDAFETIAHSVSRMERLVSQLSSRPKQPVLKKVDIREVLRKAAERSMQREPKPSLQSITEPVFSQADPEQLATVMEHLIRNAQEAINDQGSVDVCVNAQDDSVQLTISDTGCGMSSEFVRERLFRPFDSTKGSESMGIGAYQAREYIRSIGGHIDVSSEVGIGTTFVITLPLAEEALGHFD